MFARNTVLAIVATALLACGSMLAAAEPPANPPPLRIGTYDTRALALVYYRSAEFGEEMSRLTAERDKAKAAGDQKRVDELQTQGQNSQRRAHAQGFSNAPIDNILILPRFKDAIAAVAKDAKVAAVVPSVTTTVPISPARSADSRSSTRIRPRASTSIFRNGTPSTPDSRECV